MNWKRELIIKSAITTAAFAGLLTGTFAWFAAANSVAVDTFQITYGTTDDIKVGLLVDEDHPELGDPGQINYFDALTEDDLLNYGYFSKDDVLTPVSSMFQSEWLNANTDMMSDTLVPVLRNAYTSYANTTDSSVATSGFYRFIFYFKANMNMFLYLDESSTMLPDYVENAKTDPTGSLELDRIDESMRTSFLSPFGFKIWEPNRSVAGTTAFAGRLDTISADGFYDYYHADGANREILFGEYNDASKIVWSESARAAKPSTYSAFSAQSPTNALPLDLNASVANGLQITYEDSQTLTQLSDMSDAANALVYLPEYTPVRMVVTVYAEGWDRDNVDSTNAAHFLLNMHFKARLRTPRDPEPY